MTQPAKPTTFPNISGYVISERLYTGAHTTVYRGIETASQRSVILKVLLQAFPSVDDLVCFRNQYAITQNLNIPGVARPIALAPWQNGYVLVTEDFGGLSLRQYTRAHYAKGSMPVIDVLGIALQLTDILRNLSQHSV
ncbi:MAG: serine/threonine protein kinase, partial [Cyanobacteria bacterium J06627_28]